VVPASGGVHGKPETMGIKRASTDVNRGVDALLAKGDSVGSTSGVITGISQKKNRAAGQIKRAIARRGCACPASHSKPAIINQRAAVDSDYANPVDAIFDSAKEIGLTAIQSEGPRRARSDSEL